MLGLLCERDTGRSEESKNHPCGRLGETQPGKDKASAFALFVLSHCVCSCLKTTQQVLNASGMPCQVLKDLASVVSP